VYVYEIDDNDIPPKSRPTRRARPRSAHRARLYLDAEHPTLDADQQGPAERGNSPRSPNSPGTKPVAYGTPVATLRRWSREVLSLQPAGDSELSRRSAAAAAHCGFWDRLAPKPGSSANAKDSHRRRDRRRLVAAAVTAAAANGSAPSVPRLYGVGSVHRRRGRYASYRIPAVIDGADGSVLAFAEGRHAGTADSGNIDVRARRSSDGAAPGRRCSRGRGAAIPGATQSRCSTRPPNRIVLVTSYNAGTVTEAQILQGKVTPEQSRRVFVQTSSDNGATFSDLREITA